MLYHCHNEVWFDTSYWWIQIPLLHSSLPNHTAVDLFVQQVKSEFRLWIIALFFVVCRHLSLYRMSFVHMIYLSLTPSQLLMVLIIRSVRPISESSYLSKKNIICCQVLWVQHFISLCTWDHYWVLMFFWFGKFKFSSIFNFLYFF